MRLLFLWQQLKAGTIQARVRACSLLQRLRDSGLLLGDHFLGRNDHQIAVAGGFQKESRHHPGKMLRDIGRRLPVHPPIHLPRSLMLFPPLREVN